MATLVIMAAGLGSRYGGLKQIDPVGPNGEIIIDYSINDAILAGFSEVVFIIRKEDEQIFRDTIGKRIENKISTKYVFQSTDIPSIKVNRAKPWGTGHAILCCKDVVKNNFAAINADDFYGKYSFKILGDFLNNNKDPNVYSMVGFKLLNTLSENGHVSRGVCEVSGDNIKNITEIVKIFKSNDGGKYTLDNNTYINLPGDTVVSMNMWGLTPSFFNELESKFDKFLHENKNDLLTKEFFLPSVINELIFENKVNVKLLQTNDKWYGVTYKEDKDNVVKVINSLIKDGVYTSPLK